MDGVQPLENRVDPSAKLLSGVWAGEIEVLLAIAPVDVNQQLIYGVDDDGPRQVISRDIAKFFSVQDLLELVELRAGECTGKYLVFGSITTFKTICATSIYENANILVSLQTF